MDDLEVTSSSETPEQIQASLFPEEPEAAALKESEPSEPESEPVPQADGDAGATPEDPEAEEDLSKYTAKQIHDNPKLRIQKATAEAAKAKREAVEARKEAEVLRARLSQSRVVPETEDAEPQEADFNEYKDFVKAQSRWAARQVLREESQAAQARERESAIKAAATERVTGYQKQIEEAGGQEFIDTLSPDVLNIDPDGPLGVAIMESEMAPRVMTYLKEHPDELRALSGLHPIRAFREIGRIEGKLAGVAVTANAPRAVSKAKPPVRPVAGGASSGTESLDDLPFEEYFKRANARDRAH